MQESKNFCNKLGYCLLTSFDFNAIVAAVVVIGADIIHYNSVVLYTSVAGSVGYG